MVLRGRLAEKEENKAAAHPGVRTEYLLDCCLWKEFWKIKDAAGCDGVHAFSPRRGRQISEFKSGPVYMDNRTTARATP